MNGKTAARWGVGLLVGALFIWLAAREWPLSTLFADALVLDGTTLRSGSAWAFNLTYLIPYFAVLVAIHFLRVIRWYPLLKPLGDVDLVTLNRVSGVGFMYLFILPLRLGELARPYLLARVTNIPMTASLATIVVERVVDGLIVSLLLFVVLFFLPSHEQTAYMQIRIGAYAALALFTAALLVLLAMAVRREQATRVLRWLGNLFSKSLTTKILGLLDTFFDGLAALPSRRHFVDFLAWSLVYWALNGYGYYVLALGFHGLHVPLLAAYAMMCCVVVGMMLPNPPANVGVYWYFLLQPLTLYGVSTGDATATLFGLVAWLGQFVQQTSFGLFLAARGEQRAAMSLRGASLEAKS